MSTRSATRALAHANSNGVPNGKPRKPKASAAESKSARGDSIGQENVHMDEDYQESDSVASVVNGMAALGAAAGAAAAGAAAAGAAAGAAAAAAAPNEYVSPIRAVFGNVVAPEFKMDETLDAEDRKILGELDQSLAGFLNPQQAIAMSEKAVKAMKFYTIMSERHGQATNTPKAIRTRHTKLSTKKALKAIRGHLLSDEDEKQLRIDTQLLKHLATIDACAEYLTSLQRGHDIESAIAEDLEVIEADIEENGAYHGSVLGSARKIKTKARAKAKREGRPAPY
jgi:hypothetical protein